MPLILTGLASYEEDIRKSRFLALAGPVDSPAQALRFVAEHSVPDATHNCWAYRVGPEYRFHDDGEPGGTAGRPILQAIEGQDCDRVAVLVIRWFGGTKLGAGGLVRAYGGVAAQALRLAAKQPWVDESELELRCAFADVSLVRSRFAAFDARLQQEAFDAQGVVWRVAVPRSHCQDFIETFVNLTRGQGRHRLLDDAAY